MFSLLYLAFHVGVIMGVLGSEDANGDFKVVDVCFAEAAAQESVSHMETGSDQLPILSGNQEDTWLIQSFLIFRRVGQICCLGVRPRHWRTQLQASGIGSVGGIFDRRSRRIKGTLRLLHL